jgi:hypothetical protein
MANEKKTEQTFTFEVVSCLLAAMLEHGVILGNRHFSMMAQLDSSKTASGYEHTFRAAKARAKEINASRAVRTELRLQRAGRPRLQRPQPLRQAERAARSVV